MNLRNWASGQEGFKAVPRAVLARRRLGLFQSAPMPEPIIRSRHGFSGVVWQTTVHPALPRTRCIGLH